MKSAPAPNYKICIALAYWHGDADMMRSVVRLVVGFQKVHAGRSCCFMLIARRDTPMDQEMVKLLSTRFDVFTLQSNRFETGWPGGCNGVFAATIIEMATRRNDVDCFYWLETDCVPMRPDWHQVLSHLWVNRPSGIHIIGCKSSVDGSANEMHITGCAIYDAKIAMKIQKLVGPGHGAWDWECRFEMCQAGMHTDRIWLKFRAATADPAWMGHSDMPAIIHGVKDKSLLQMMGDKYGVKV